MLQLFITPSFSISLAYLHPPSLLLARRLVGDKFGGEQAKGGQTRSLCVYTDKQETGWGGDDVASVDRAQWGPGGGRSAKKKDYTSPLVLLMPWDCKHTGK